METASTGTKDPVIHIEIGDTGRLQASSWRVQFFTDSEELIRLDPRMNHLSML